MKERKVRVTVTVDRQVLRAANAAIAEGKSGSLSAWVNEALTERAARDRRLHVLAQLVAGHEAEHGAIGDEDAANQRRTDRKKALVVRNKARRTAG